MALDILDIMLGKKKAQGEAATIMASAREALSTATSAAEDAAAASAAAQEANETAISAATTAEEAAENVTQMRDDITAAAESLIDSKMKDEYLPQINESLETAIEQASEAKSIADEVKEVTNKAVIDWRTSVTTPTSKAYKDYTAQVKKANGDIDAWVASRNYTATGQNEDGAMTQKAITNALNAQKTELETKISKMSGGGSSSGSTDLGKDNAGSVVIVGDDGTIIASGISENEVIEALIKSGSYSAKNAVGLTIDYEEKTFTRGQEAKNLVAGTSFDKYSAFGGRMRCNVADDGTITAFYGDAAFKENGSNGQVMVYQPKFYYRRVPLATRTSVVGNIVRQETIIVSTTEQTGFKLHPLFKTVDGEELDYILYSAYEGSCYDVSENKYVEDDNNTIDFTVDKLSSIANVKPISGAKNEFNIINAEKMATNRGAGWHITNMAAESANQMLFLIEYGTLNAQNALEAGLTNLTNNATLNYASQTGSTSNLGNTSGAASSTINITNGVTNTYLTAGYRAISYRGMENPWGNIWRFIGGVNINGNGQQQGGIPYICDDFNYTPATIGENYHSVGFALPTASVWTSALGYGEEEYDWVLMPAEASNASSALPIGDYIWVTNYLNTTNIVTLGGPGSHKENDGLFYYGCDNSAVNYSRVQSARLMFIPTKNSIYERNIAAWSAKF